MRFWEVEMVNINDLNNHDMSYIKTMDDVKDYLGCVISEDESFDDVQYSLELILERLRELNK